MPQVKDIFLFLAVFAAAGKNRLKSPYRQRSIFADKAVRSFLISDVAA
jgi:hypothetical protein